MSFKAGPAIFLNKLTAFEVTLGYNHSKRGPVDTVATNTIQIGAGLQIHIGKDLVSSNSCSKMKINL